MENEMGPRHIQNSLPAIQPSQGSQSQSTASSERRKAERRAIAEQVATLLNHYWTPADDPRVKARMAADWISDLEDFGAEIVAEACAEWRRGNDRRPTPSAVRAICFRLREERKPRAPALPQLTHDERVQAARRAADQEGRYAEAFKWRQQFAEERGFPDFAAVIEYGIVAAAKLKPIAERGVPAAPAEEIKP